MQHFLWRLELCVFNKIKSRFLVEPVKKAKQVPSRANLYINTLFYKDVEAEIKSVKFKNMLRTLPRLRIS